MAAPVAFPSSLPPFERCVVLSQGETRPGVVHGQHWGTRLHPLPTPARRPNPRLSHPVLR